MADYADSGSFLIPNITNETLLEKYISLLQSQIGMNEVGGSSDNIDDEYALIIQMLKIQHESIHTIVVNNLNP